MTPEELKKIAPYAAKSKCAVYAPLLTSEMQKFGVITQLQVCHFIAQILHESGSLNYVRELASGKAYEGRKDLGNTAAGDGVKYKGRGLIQITGRANYKLCGDFLGLDLLNNPDLLEMPYNAVRSALWFWKTKNLNKYADADDVMSVTKRINGGYNGLQERKLFLQRAKQIL